MNGTGALVSLLTGFVLGMGRLVLELNQTALPDGLLLDLVNMNFLHFAGVLFAVCSVVLVLVSLATKAPDRGRLAGLTLATSRTAEKREPVNPVVFIGSLLLVFAVIAVWIIFSSWGLG